jgi:dCMP deaminase
VRPTIETTIFTIAQAWATRGTCCKKKVGAVIIDKNNNVLSSGYNGQPRGYPHCDDAYPCDAFFNPKISCNAIHAEINALIRCLDVDKAHAIFVTEKPCDKCMLAIRNTFIEYVYYPDDLTEYRKDNIRLK